MREGLQEENGREPSPNRRKWQGKCWKIAQDSQKLKDERQPHPEECSSNRKRYELRHEELPEREVEGNSKSSSCVSGDLSQRRDKK